MKLNTFAKAIIALVIFLTAPSVSYAANHPPRAVAVVPASGVSITNQSVTFSASYMDPDGNNNLAACHLRINNTTAGAKCFSGYYNGNTNKMYILNDAGKKWLGGYVPGASAVIANSYVNVDCSKCSIIRNGNTLTVIWAVSFKSKFAGSKNIYMRATDKKKAGSGPWAKKGTWKMIDGTLSVSVDPQEWNIGAVQPNSVTTMPQTNKITITNNGTLSESFELQLVNTSEWSAGTNPAEERYALNALICGIDSVPKAADFNADSGSEDALTLEPKKATASVFGYAAGAGNGLSVPAGNKRALYLQFKSPVRTVSTAENKMSIIVNCQMA